MQARNNVRKMILQALFAALMTVCAWMSVPLAVPFTMQTFALFAALNLLGGRGTLACLAVYYLMGAVGLPVFSGFSGGLVHLIGPTGGYMLGFAVTALIYDAAVRHLGAGRRVRFIAMLVGLLACYAFGTAWFMAVYAARQSAVTLGAALSLCVLPYVLPDLVKLVLALMLSERISKAVKP